MTNINTLAERHISEHISRLQHIDELVDDVEKAARESRDKAQYAAELGKIKCERDEFAGYIEKLKEKSPQQMMETGGPMVMWELIAQKLQKLLDKIQPHH